MIESKDGGWIGLRYCVLYLVAGVERQSPWFYNRARARTALNILKAKYGEAVIYVD